jgi:hypothetical protein
VLGMLEEREATARVRVEGLREVPPAARTAWEAAWVPPGSLSSATQPGSDRKAVTVAANCSGAS